MKFKYNIFVLILCLFMIPCSVKADKVYTTITGNDKIQAGDNIKYTVILDTELTEYEAEITYDRQFLNLVGVDEVKSIVELKDTSIEIKTIKASTLIDKIKTELTPVDKNFELSVFEEDTQDDVTIVEDSNINDTVD